MVKLFQFGLFNNYIQDCQDLHSGFGEAEEMTTLDVWFLKLLVGRKISLWST